MLNSKRITVCMLVLAMVMFVFAQGDLVYAGNDTNNYTLTLSLLDENYIDDFENDVFKWGNSRFFDNTRGPSEGSLKLNMINVNSDHVKINGVIKANDDTIPFSGIANLENIIINNETCKIGRIVAESRIKHNNVGIIMFVFFDVNVPDNAYVSVSLSSMNDEEGQGLLIFGNKTTNYLTWFSKVQLDNADTSTDSSNNDYLNENDISIMSSSNTVDWVWKTSAQTNFIQRLSWPFTSYDNTPILYLNMLARDPYSIQEHTGDERIRIIGQESVVRNLYGVTSAKLWWVDFDVWYNQSDVQIWMALPSGTHNVPQLIAVLWTSLFPKFGWISTITSAFSGNSFRTFYDSNGDGYINKVEYSVGVGNHSSSVPEGTDHWNTYMYDGGINLTLTYRSYLPSGVYWRIHAEGLADFMLHTSGSNSILTRTGHVYSSHLVRSR